VKQPIALPYDSPERGFGPGRERWTPNSLASDPDRGLFTVHAVASHTLAHSLMESSPDHASDDGPSVNASDGGRLRRIAGHTRGLVDDLREWIDLRLDLAILEVEERVDELRNEVALGLTLAFFGFFAVFFVLVTVALGLGWALGHPFWGFLIVAVLLTLFVSVLARTRPDLAPPSELFERIRGGDDSNSVAHAPVEDPHPAADASRTDDT